MPFAERDPRWAGNPGKANRPGSSSGQGPGRSSPLCLQERGLEIPRLKQEMGKLKAPREALERERRQLERLRQERVRGEGTLVRIEAFCERVSQGLENLGFEER